MTSNNSTKAQEAVQKMTSSVQHIEDAAQAAEAIITQTSDHIRNVTADVNPSDEDEVDACLTHLEEFADELDAKASELSAAVVAGTPADPSAAASTVATPGTGSTQDPIAGTAAATGEAHPSETVPGAAQAGGYNSPDAANATPAEQPPLPPAAGQHPDVAPEDAQPENSTLTDAENPPASEEVSSNPDVAQQTPPTDSADTTDATSAPKGTTDSGTAG